MTPKDWDELEEFVEKLREDKKTQKESLAVSSRITPEVLATITHISQITGRLLGGLLAGLGLLILSLQRRQIGAGVIAFILCLMVAPLFGALATIVPGGILYFYLRRKRVLRPPEIAPPAGWIILLWAVFLSALSLVLQIGATMFATVPLALKPDSSLEQITALLMSDGTVFLISINANWIVFLALLTICKPLNRRDWKKRLGLHPVPMIPGILWGGLALFVLLGLSQLLDLIMDARSREMIAHMALGAQSPVVFYLAIILIAPVVEELIFRGYAYSGWIHKIGFWWTAIASSLLFTACHIQYGLVALCFIFFLGMILAGLRWKTGSIYPGLGVHILNNLVACLTMQFFPPAG